MSRYLWSLDDLITEPLAAQYSDEYVQHWFNELLKQGSVDWIDEDLINILTKLGLKDYQFQRLVAGPGPLVLYTLYYKRQKIGELRLAPNWRAGYGTRFMPIPTDDPKLAQVFLDLIADIKIRLCLGIIPLSESPSAAVSQAEPQADSSTEVIPKELVRRWRELNPPWQPAAADEDEVGKRHVGEPPLEECQDVEHVGNIHELDVSEAELEALERQAELPVDSGAVGEEATAAEGEEGKVGIFFAYAREDENLRDELQKHLSILERQGVITSWHDRKIGAGKEWKGEIDTHLNTARVILLLISSDFIDSDYCWDVEVKRAMERHEAGEARVIPVILRPVDWKSAPFGKLQALPTDAKPVTRWENQDEAFLDIARGIRAAVMELRMEDNDSDPNHEKHNL